MIPFSLFLGIHVYSEYGSRYLAEKLSQFGFCKGYHEILRYEKNVALTSETRELFINENQTAAVAINNADDNPANLDERDTVHTMGMILTLSPAESNGRLSIPPNIVSNAQLSKLSSNLIFNFSSEGVKQLVSLKYKGYIIPAVCDKYDKLDCFWK